MTDIHGPTSHNYFSQRLRLHYVDWGNEEAEPLLMVHGGQDHCRNWDWLAQEMRDDYHIIAPDLRGHGDSQSMVGGSYGSFDFVYDIHQLLHQTKMTPVNIIAHSMGGHICLRFAGVYPELVKKMVVIEGLGMNQERAQKYESKPIHERVRAWEANLRKTSGRNKRRYATLDDAINRMHEANPHLRPDQARHLTIHGAHQNEDGTYSWKYDNYVRTGNPGGISTEQSHELWSNITCPVMLVRGTESGRSAPEEDGRLAHFQNATVVNVEEAGHWVHHDQLGVFLEHVRPFLAD
jgi:pimeloyl-ACP methyl ester carboxylesterase